MRRLLLVLVAAAAGCQSALDDQPELVTAPLIIAVQATPAEAPPGAPITLRAFVATPDGSAEPALEWAFCASPKPLGENNVVDPACVTAQLPPAGPDGISVETTMPASACQLFGPEIPPQTGSAPPSRPRDADGTGGYYQPVRVRLGESGSVAFALIRVRCRLAMAPFAVAQDFEARYVANQNPAIADTEVTEGGLEAAWPAESAESYVRFDPASQALVTQTETLSVRWFATAPLGAPASTGTESSVSGTAPHSWIVLRDDRGGVDVRAIVRAIDPPP